MIRRKAVSVFLCEDPEAELEPFEGDRRLGAIEAELHEAAAARRDEDLARRRQLDDVARCVDACRWDDGRIHRRRSVRLECAQRHERTSADRAHRLEPIATGNVIIHGEASGGIGRRVY